MPLPSSAASKTHIIAHIHHWPVFPDAPGKTTLTLGSEVTALIGRNGTGKTRLCRFLLGMETWPDASAQQHSDVGYLPQTSLPPNDVSIACHLGVQDALRALEVLDRGEGLQSDLETLNDRWTLHDDMDEALTGVGLHALDLQRPVSSLSGGEFTRLELVRLQLSGASFLILDEPTNHLDEAARAYVLQFLSSWQGGLLVVSHDREVLRIANRILELSSFGLTTYHGDYDDFLAQKELEADAAERLLTTRTKAVRQVRHQTQMTREKSDKRRAKGRKDADRKDMPKSWFDGRKEAAQNTMGKDKMRAALQMDRAKDELKQAEEGIERFRKLAFDLPTSGVKKGQALLKVRDFSFGYGDASAPLIEDISFTLSGGDKIALTGKNGSGKSTLLKLIGGQLKHDGETAGGEFVLFAKRMAWLDQKTELIEGAETVMDAFMSINPATTPGQAHAALARFLFRNDDAFKRVEHLSGGERLRTALAALLYSPEPPDLLLLDEPNNHLDLDSQIAVAEALSAFDGGILIVSHDEAFLGDVGVTGRVELFGPSL